jgi:hypothetical protein
MLLLGGEVGLPQQLRQFGDVGGDAPGLVAGEEFGRRTPGRAPLRAFRLRPLPLDACGTVCRTLVYVPRQTITPLPNRTTRHRAHVRTRRRARAFRQRAEELAEAAKEFYEEGQASPPPPAGRKLSEMGFRIRIVRRSTSGGSHDVAGV